MNSKIFNAIVLLGLCLSISCSQVTISALEKIKINEFANDFVGQQIVDTVLLQQQSGGSTDVVIRLLNGLVQDLAKQQAVHTAQFLANNKLWKNQLKSYRATVLKLTSQINSLVIKLLGLKKAIKLSRYTIKYTSAQIVLVQAKNRALTAARNVDRQAFLKRQTRQTEMQKAINYIINQLQLALKSGQFVQLNDIKEQLAKLAKENPLQALVELTMTFNPASVQYAITKLNEIRVALIASLKNELKQEAQASKQYTQLNQQMTSFLKSAIKQLAKAKTQLTRQLNNQGSLRRQKKESLSLRKSYRKLIVQTVETRKSYNAQYKQNTAKRSSETVIIKKVINIIQLNAPQVNRAEDFKTTLKA